MLAVGQMSLFCQLFGHNGEINCLEEIDDHRFVSGADDKLLKGISEPSL